MVEQRDQRDLQRDDLQREDRDEQRVRDPGTCIHANAYAARDAMNSGSSTAGMVMTIELMKYWLRLARLPGASAVW